MTHTEGPNFLEAQPPCSMQGSSGVAVSRNGVAKGISEVRGVEFRPPKALASSTALEGSITSHCIATLPLNSATLFGTFFPGGTLLDSHSPKETTLLCW